MLSLPRQPPQPVGGRLRWQQPAGVPLPSQQPAGVPLPSQQPAGVPLPSQQPAGVPLPSQQPAGVPLPSQQPAGVPLPSQQPAGVPLPWRLVPGQLSLSLLSARFYGVSALPARAPRAALLNDLDGTGGATGYSGEFGGLSVQNLLRELPRPSFMPLPSSPRSTTKRPGYAQWGQALSCAEGFICPPVGITRFLSMTWAPQHSAQELVLRFAPAVELVLLYMLLDSCG
ncbi:hypothetical protein Achl_1090 [Pseudarthrobacter chlorophenolicus A6]|uniref:Uncharacterized protein n=1 Tax=Pseudarthrobacter chlorophenolicus (strain ATCC 700700 / DSM 12829 / CIP 107037 / JCM 12360 / KCTC 9906 / NCIMB 13794 / A6) TaxID=452863 RepID=B8HE48_PSECP|nr:hypothetical protein Achl_1090 [Pseudarthrobacter chlorophenolicus A6]SDR04659.1 hypothetical protein SAMN04489738_4437 [Pseudarthrobacter chlorophenolicus]